MTSIELTKLAVAALQDKKAEDIRVLNIGNVSPIADYFIIATGNNVNQLSAMQDAVDEAMVKAGAPDVKIEGNRQSTWILMDYTDVIVHLFSTDDRLFYNLEKVWTDGEELDVNNL